MALGPQRPKTIQRQANTSDCMTLECRDMFQRISSSLDAIHEEQRAARTAISEAAKLTSALDVQVANLWHQLRRVEEGVSDIPTTVTASLARHEDTCVGRSYVLGKIRTRTTGANPVYRSEAPPAAKRDRIDRMDVTTTMRRAYGDTPPTDEISKIVPPWKLAIYAGLLLGAAVVAAVMIAGRMGLFDLFSAVGK